MAESSPTPARVKPDQLAAQARRTAYALLKDLETGHPEGADIETRVKALRTLLPTLYALSDIQPPPPPGGIGHPSPPTPGDSEPASSHPAATRPASSERSEEKAKRFDLQVRPDFEDCDPATLQWCGSCKPLTDRYGWGFNERLGRPCDCQLGRYRSWMVGTLRTAEERAAAEAQLHAGEVDPRVANLVEGLLEGGDGAAA